MTALVRKELRRLLPLAVIVGSAFTGLWGVVFDVFAFTVPPSPLLGAVLLLGLNVGGLLGYLQVAQERDGQTLGYLLHRPVSVGRALVAKTVAGWILLALMIPLPVIAYAWLERTLAPAADEVFRWARVWEVVVACIVCVPAHALGVFVGALRADFAWRITFGAFALGGAGAAVAWGLGVTAWGPGTSQALFVLAALAATVGLLGAARASLMDGLDGERAPAAPTVVAVVVVVGCVLAGGQRVIWHVERGVLNHDAWVRPGVVFSEEDGAALIEHYPGQWVVRGVDGEALDYLDSNPARTGSREGRWIGVWSPDGGLASELRALDGDARSEGTVGNSARTAPNLTPSWRRIRNRLAEQPGRVRVSLYHDAERGELHVFGRGPEESGRSSLRTFRRPDGAAFSPSTRVDPSADDDVVLVSDPEVGAAWRFAWARTQPRFERIEHLPWEAREALDPQAAIVGRFRTFTHRPPAGEADSEATPPSPAEFEGLVRVRPEVEGDLWSSRVRVVDVETGDVLLEHVYRSASYATMGVHALLVGSELLRAPLTHLYACVAGDPWAAWTAEPSFLPWATAAGRRPWLVLASFLLSLALASLAHRELRARGVGVRRRRAWGAAILLGGPSYWFAYLLAEPRPNVSARAERRQSPAGPQLLLQTSEATV